MLTALVGAHGFGAPARPRDGGKYSVAGLDDEGEVERFFTAFKEAVARGDKGRVASMVSYPIAARRSDGRRVRLRNRAAFVRSYDAIFDGAFKKLIAETGVGDLWAKSSGVATPRGEVWFNGVVRDEKRPEEYVILITSINGPIDDGR